MTFGKSTKLKAKRACLMESDFFLILLLLPSVLYFCSLKHQHPTLLSTKLKVINESFTLPSHFISNDLLIFSTQFPELHALVLFLA